MKPPPEHSRAGCEWPIITEAFTLSHITFSSREQELSANPTSKSIRTSIFSLHLIRNDFPPINTNCFLLCRKLVQDPFPFYFLRLENDWNQSISRISKTNLYVLTIAYRISSLVTIKSMKSHVIDLKNEKEIYMF